MPVAEDQPLGGEEALSVAVHGVQIARPNPGGRRRRRDKKEAIKWRVTVIANNRLSIYVEEEIST